MPSVMEAPRLATWLYGVLSGTAAVTAVFGTRIYRGGLAPPGATYPLLLFHLLSGLDMECLGADVRAGVNTVYFVRGVALPAQYISHLKPGMDAVDAALWDRQAVSAGYRFTVDGSPQFLEYDDPPEGGVPVYTNLGRQWRIRAEPV